MMRISREEEHAIGRARPAMHGRVKVGFTKEGRVTAVDMFTVTEGGPYGPGGDGNTASQYASLMYQPETFRYRGITAITNTPPRGALSQPGGFQGCEIMDHIVNESGAQARHRSGGDPQAERAGRQGEVRAGQCERRPRLRDELLSSRKRWTRARRGSTGTNVWRVARNATDRRCAAWASASAPTAAARSGSTACSSSSQTAGCTSIRASAISAPNRSPTASAWRRRWSACRGRKWRSSGAIRRRTCRGVATRAAARPYMRIRARRMPPRPTRSRSCSRLPPRISAGSPKTTS